MYIHSWGGRRLRDCYSPELPNSVKAYQELIEYVWQFNRSIDYNAAPAHEARTGSSLDGKSSFSACRGIWWLKELGLPEASMQRIFRVRFMCKLAIKKRMTRLRCTSRVRKGSLLIS